MKIGDLVTYVRDNQGCIGLIIDIKSSFSAGGGGEWPSSETHVIISWTNKRKQTWITNEREEDLEVINESR